MKNNIYQLMQQTYSWDLGTGPVMLQVSLNLIHQKKESPQEQGLLV